VEKDERKGETWPVRLDGRYAWFWNVERYGPADGGFSGKGWGFSIGLEGEELTRVRGGDGNWTGPVGSGGGGGVSMMIVFSSSP
jgi:hypothetical protein